VTELDFKALVESDVRNGLNKTEKDVLHEDLNTWHDCLKALKRDVETQFAAKRAKLLRSYAQMSDGTMSESDYNYEYADDDFKKVGSMRFLQAIEARMAYVKALKRSQHEQTTPKVTVLSEHQASATG